MIPWTSFERRWRDALCDALLPGDAATAMPSFTDAAASDAWDQALRAGSPLLRLGLRASTWSLTFLPPLVLRVPRPFSALTPEERARFLAAVAQSDVFALRQMLMALKTVACMVYLRDARVRARVDEAAR